MTAATITTRLEVNDPTVEVVVLEASDGETYTSKKFGEITAAHLTLNEDTDADYNVTFSGATATINIASATDQTCTLTLYGKM